MALHERLREIPGVNFVERKHQGLTWFIDRLIPEVTLVGNSRENLEQMREIRKAGKPVEIFPRHIANTDAPAIYKMLVDEGFGEIANDTVYILGNKLKQNLFNPLTDAYPHITVWPPTIPAETDKDKEAKNEMNALATKATKEVLARGGVIVMFAQGGREKGDHFKAFETSTGGYLSMNRDIVVFPLAITDTDKSLTPAPASIREAIPKRHSAVMHMGEPITVTDLRKKFSKGTNAEVFAQRLGYIHGKLIEGQGEITKFKAEQS